MFFPSEASPGGHGGYACTLDHETSERKTQALELSTLLALRNTACTCPKSDLSSIPPITKNITDTDGRLCVSLAPDARRGPVMDAGLMLTVRWPDEGNDQPVSLYTRNRPSSFFACRVLAIEYDRHEQFLSVHFDVRGEGDLVEPRRARLRLGPKTPAMSPGMTRVQRQQHFRMREASPIPHRVCRLDPRREAYVALPMPSAAGVATLAPYPPAINLWTSESNLDVAWSTSASGKRCIGHVTFNMKEFEESLREWRSSAAHGVPLQLNFLYSKNPTYHPVTLAEWPTEEHVSIATALRKYSGHGGKVGMHAPGELSGIVNLSQEEDTIEYAKERFRFAPDDVKSRPRWWA